MWSIPRTLSKFWVLEHFKLSYLLDSKKNGFWVDFGSQKQKCSKLVKNHGFDKNGGHHELRLEKSLKLHYFMLIFEPRPPMS